MLYSLLFTPRLYLVSAAHTLVAMPVEEVATSNNSVFRNNEDGLSPDEVWWKDHQVWLQEKGYLLRPRYHPGWKPSRKGTHKLDEKLEDSIENEVSLSDFTLCELS